MDGIEALAAQLLQRVAADQAVIRIQQAADQKPGLVPGCITVLKSSGSTGAPLS